MGFTGGFWIKTGIIPMFVKKCENYQKPLTKNLRSNIVATVDISTPQKRVLANQREEVRGLELDERKEKILKAIIQTLSLIHI